MCICMCDTNYYTRRKRSFSNLEFIIVYRNVSEQNKYISVSQSAIFVLPCVDGILAQRTMKSYYLHTNRVLSNIFLLLTRFSLSTAIFLQTTQNEVCMCYIILKTSRNIIKASARALITFFNRQNSRVSTRLCVRTFACFVY